MITDVSKSPTTARNRDLYLDALRTAAIVRVVTYHSFTLPWLSWVFPAMGMMFALAGGLMVRSLDRQPAKTVIKNRFRRLLPALWVFGAVWITLMTVKGGSPTNWADPVAGDGSKIPVWHLVYWLVPVFDPPGNTWGFDGTEVLWYLRTYLWLVALSPLLLKAFRKWPIPTLVAPLLVLVLQSFHVIPDSNSGNLWGIGEVWDLVATLATYAPCWMLGFAHRTGKLSKLTPTVTLALSVVFGAVGAMWALTHDSETYDLNGIPLSQALWSIAFILPLLRFAPQDSSWIGRTPFLGRAVALVNNRAVTIYLWHNVLIDLSYPIEDKLSAAAPALANVVYNPVWNYFVIWILIAGAVLIFGWVEDVAARRSPRLFPVGPSAAERRAADEAAKETERAEAQTVHSADQLRYPATASRPVAAQTAVHPPAYGNQPPYDQYDQGYGNNAQRGTVYGAPQPRPPREERPYDEGPYGRGDDRTQPYPAQPYPIQPHPPRHRGEE